MTIDEAIKHCEEVAEAEEQKYKDWRGDYPHLKKIDSCLECANEHRQLAEWLKELKAYRERIPSYEAGYNDAKREIALSGEYERAYERGKSDAEQTKWIPVSERLPENDDCVLVYDGVDYFVAWYGINCNWHSTDGNFDEYTPIIAWMPLPNPYRGGESDAK